MFFWTWNIQNRLAKNKKTACSGAERSRRNNVDALITTYGQQEEQRRDLRRRQHLLIHTEEVQTEDGRRVSQGQTQERWP